MDWSASVPFRRKNCDDVLSRHEFTPAMLFCGKYPDCVSGTKKHPIAKGDGMLLWWTACVLEREPPPPPQSKRADCHDCTAPVRESTDTRRNECATVPGKVPRSLHRTFRFRLPSSPPNQNGTFSIPSFKKSIRRSFYPWMLFVGAFFTAPVFVTDSLF